MSDLKCADCKQYLFHNPVQCPCGDRLCGGCYESYKSSNRSKIICPLCQTDFLLEDCFRDRAATLELRKAILKCDGPGCSWEGKSEKYEEHIQTCQELPITETNEAPQRSEHVYNEKTYYPQYSADSEDECNYLPMQCEQDGLMLHLANDYQMFPQFCVNGCGEKIPRKDMEKHSTMCTRQIKACDYKEEGCTFLGYTKDLTKHYKEQCVYHTELMKQSFKKIEKSMDNKIKTLTSDVKSAVVKTESAMQHLQEGFSEMALMVQTLQATSYNGVFIWKIPEIQRRRHEVKMGKTVSLYSAPFYTSPHGYKLCLRLYINGDEIGKSTHLSFFFAVMKGEYDTLLQWPFKQTVTLMLLDQDKLKDIVQSFRPDPSVSSFQRPRNELVNEMNVASGCPMFAPLSVLNNSCYVKDDTMFLKCKIDTAGINMD